MVLPGTLDEDELARRLKEADAAIIMKVGRNLPKIRRALAAAGRLERAHYVERGTMADCAGMPLATRADSPAPYFSSCSCRVGARAVSGWLRVVGLGPGAPFQMTPEAQAALEDCEEIYGYGPYLAAYRTARQRRVASDNREERSRADAALARAAEGTRVALVSGGDPGVFAMAAAVCEAIEHGPSAWRHLDVQVIPGVTAMLAVAARVGAPLGHDFCAINLSDNLKPWPLVERRLLAVAEAGFVIALYNPISRARPWQLGAALDLLGTRLPVQRLSFSAGPRPAGRAHHLLRPCGRGRRAGGHGHLRHHRLAGDPHHFPRWPAAFGLHAPERFMTARLKPDQSSVHIIHGFHGGHERAAQQHDLDTERARRRHLAVGGRPPGVFRDDDVNGVVRQQPLFVCCIERSARDQIGRIRHTQGGKHRVHAAHDINMLGRRLEARTSLRPSARKTRRAFGPGRQRLARRRPRHAIDPPPAPPKARDARRGGDGEPGHRHRPHCAR